MKILHVSKFYPPYRGGIEDVCYNIVQALQEHTQKVFCFNDKKTDSISVINNVEIIRIGTCKSTYIFFILHKTKKGNTYI